MLITCSVRLMLVEIVSKISVWQNCQIVIVDWYTASGSPIAVKDPRPTPVPTTLCVCRSRLCIIY